MGYWDIDPEEDKKNQIRKCLLYTYPSGPFSENDLREEKRHEQEIIRRRKRWEKELSSERKGKFPLKKEEVEGLENLVTTIMPIKMRDPPNWLEYCKSFCYVKKNKSSKEHCNFTLFIPAIQWSLCVYRTNPCKVYLREPRTITKQINFSTYRGGDNKGRLFSLDIEKYIGCFNYWAEFCKGNCDREIVELLYKFPSLRKTFPALKLVNGKSLDSEISKLSEAQ